MRKPMILLSAFLLVQPAVIAQYSPGDVLAIRGADVLRITPGGSVQTAFPLPGTPLPYSPPALIPSPDNRSMWLFSDRLYALWPDGRATTIASGVGAAPLGVDDDARMIVRGTNGTVFALHPRTARLTTLWSPPWTSFGYYYHMALDPQQPGSVLLSHRSGLYRTHFWPVTTVVLLGRYNQDIFGGGPNFGSADPVWYPEREALVGPNGSSLNELSLRSPGPSRSFAALGPRRTSHSFCRLPSGNLMLTVYYVSPSPPMRPGPRPTAYPVRVRADVAAGLVEIDPRTGTPIWTAPHFVVGTARAGSRHLASTGAARRGLPWMLQASFPADPGANYVAAASLGLSRGVRLAGGHSMFLQPDALFSYSLTNAGIFQNFRGTLTARGEAWPTVMIPRAAALAGVVVYVSTAAVRNGRIVGVSLPVGSTIR